MLPIITKLRTRLEQLTCGGDRAFLQQQMQALHDESHDPVYRMQMAELLRFGCTSENVIRGYRGQFAGCVGGGGNGKAVHSQEIHSRGGMKAEIDLRMHERGARAYTKANGAAAYKAEHDSLTSQAKAGAAELTPKDKAILKADLKSTVAKAAELEGKGRDASHYRNEAVMLQRQLARAGVKATGKGAQGPRAPRNAEKKANLRPIAKMEGFKPDPFAPIDPYFYLKIYGHEQFPLALGEQTLGTLKVIANKLMADNPGTKPRTKSAKADVIDYIVKTVADHPSSPVNTHPADTQRQSLRLRIQLAALKAY